MRSAMSLHKHPLEEAINEIIAIRARCANALAIAANSLSF